MKLTKRICLSASEWLMNMRDTELNITYRIVSLYNTLYIVVQNSIIL